MPEKPLAYDAYEQLADGYAAHIETKPHNAYYERPATLSLLPDVIGKKVLDVGCGPGKYADILVERGAHVVACDVSDAMLVHARRRLGNRAQLVRVDISQPLTIFHAGQFDLIVAPLCLDYIEDWQSVFREFHRILVVGGTVVFSCGHPAFDAEYFNTFDYFSVEQVDCTWQGFGTTVRMPSYRRSLEAIMAPVIEAGFVLERIHEPQPTAEFKAADPIHYRELLHRPGFLCVRAGKVNG